MKRIIYALFVFVAVLFWGCYPGGAEYTEELDLVYTNYDKNFDFASKKTYSLPNQIVKITGDITKPPEYVKPAYADAMLARIDANMQGLGWTKVNVDDSPNIQLLPAAWESTTIIYGGYYGGYWCWYYPYYCGGGWYYPYPVATSYTTGTLLVTIVDPNTESTDDSKYLAWTGAINGLLSGSWNPDRVNKSIDQLFIQSPYLQVK